MSQNDTATSIPTLAQIAVAKKGVIKGSRVLTFIASWAIAEEALGHPPSIEEYAEWWKESRSTVYREQARFRECFPHEATPQRIVDLLKAQRSSWKAQGVKGLGQVRLAL